MERRDRASLAGILLIIGGCQMPAWLGGPKTTPSPTPATVPGDQLIPGRTTNRKLSACMEEYVGFVFSIRPRTGIDKPSLRVDRPAGMSPGTMPVELDRVHPVHVDRFPGWHVRAIPPSLREHDPLDVVVPLKAPQGGMPGRLDAGGDYHFWFETKADKGTLPGTYKLPIVLTSGKETVGTLEVELTVWPVVLPEDGELMALGEVDHVGLFRHHVPQAANRITSATVWHDLPQREEFDGVLGATTRMLHRHRVAPLLPDLRPTVKVSARGELDVDWSNYDRVATPLLGGQAFENRVGVPIWPLPVRSIVRPAKDEAFLGPGSEALARQYVEQCARHFAQRGWLERSFANLDNPNDFAPESVAAAKQAIAIARGANRDVRIASRRFPQDMRPFGWFDFPTVSVPQADVWISDAQFFDAPRMSAERAAGRQTWLAVDRPPFSGTAALPARPCDTLALSWQARLLGAKYLWLGLVNGWPDQVARPNPSDCVRFDPRALIFPGAAFGLDEPVATLRLKRIRETMQQAAYVKLLEQQDRGHIGDALLRELVERAGTAAYRTNFADGRPIGWTEDAERFEAARQIMAAEIVNIASKTLNEEQWTSPASNLLWRSFMTTSGGVRVRVDGTRVRLAGTPLALKFAVETSLSVSNQGREPFRGNATWTDIPTVCSADRNETLDLPAGTSQRLIRTLVCEPRWLETRNPEFGFTLAQRDGEPMVTPVGVSLLVAEPTDRPLTIDGDLSDWVAAAGNGTWDFRLIAGDCGDRNKDCDQPSLRTFAFVRRDAGSLYVGINAESQGDDSSMRRKEVPYEDLIPADVEDLVEILIDPLNGGTRSPADLFRVVVKRSGIYLTERGLTTSPPIGPRRLWPADIEVSSRAGQQRWTTEVRIPLAAFERPGTVKGEIWGFNVTRYDARRQEFSTWSGAVGNAYDPMTLGNLLLP